MKTEIITKQEFIDIMKEINDVFDYHDKLNKFFNKHGVSGYIFQPDCICSTVKLLNAIFKDTNEWINYFCFELDFGRKYKDGFVKDEFGKDISLSTYEDLYNILTE